METKELAAYTELLSNESLIKGQKIEKLKSRASKYKSSLSILRKALTSPMIIFRCDRQSSSRHHLIIVMQNSWSSPLATSTRARGDDSFFDFFFILPFSAGCESVDIEIEILEYCFDTDKRSSISCGSKSILTTTPVEPLVLMFGESKGIELTYFVSYASG
jgi:hypothetical protein